MKNSCTRPFDEELISGYVDRSLPQAQAQRVRLHLEDCPVCRKLHDEIRTLREAAMTTRFDAPDDDAWTELPATRPSRFSRSLGWLLMLGWLAIVCVLALWRSVSSAEDPLDLFLVLGLPGGLLLLLVSVLIDRFRDLKTDRYRGVHR